MGKIKINKEIEMLKSWNLILTICLLVIFSLLVFSIIMIIKIESKVYETKEFSENNWDWIQKFYTRILKIEWELEDYTWNLSENNLSAKYYKSWTNCEGLKNENSKP